MKLRKLGDRASCMAPRFGVDEACTKKGVAYPCAGMLTDLQFRSSPFPSEVELQIFFLLWDQKDKKYIEVPRLVPQV